MFKFSHYLKNYKLYLVLGPLFKLLEAIFELIVPLVMADIIDNGINGANASVSYILGRGGVLVALAILGLGFSLICQYFASKCSQGFGTELRSAMFRHVNKLSFKELDTIGTASTVTRLTSDIDQMQHAVAMLIRLVIRAPFLVVGSAVMAIIINPKLAMIFLVVAPLISLALYFIMKSTIPRYGKVQKNLDKVTSIARENINGARVVRAFSEENTEQKKFDNAADDLSKQAISVGRISALLNPVIMVVINLGIVAILYFGGGSVNRGEMTQGEIIAFINYLTQISLALVAVADLVIIYTKTVASSLRLREVFNLQSSIKDDGNTEITPCSDAPKIEFRNVSFGYKDGGYALKNLSVSIAKGQTIGIIGGTGSGKSTLVNLIPRFYDTSSGEVLVDGVNVKNYPLKQLRGEIGYVPQRATLLSGTIRSNMQLADIHATDAEIDDALSVAQAKAFVYDNADGLDYEVNQNGKNFSGGQRQRLTIARALVGKPSILILDDSMSALDLETDLELRRALIRERKNITTIVVSQRTTSIKYADFIIVLDNGEVVGIGKHLDLLKTCPVYKEICLSQDIGERI